MSNIRVVDMTEIPSGVRRNYARAPQVVAMMLESIGKAVETDITTKGELSSLVKSVKQICEKEGYEFCWQRDKNWTHGYFWIPVKEVKE